MLCIENQLNHNLPKEKSINLKNEIKQNNYIYVFCSTQNQVVNYIPIKFFSENSNCFFKKIYNITISGSDLFPNEKWDENLKNVLQRDGFEIADQVTKNTIEIKQEQITLISEVKRKIKTKFFNKIENKNILWNMTGGQRPFIIAIYDLIKNNFIKKNGHIKKRNNHKLCYIEGNTNTMIFYDLDDNCNGEVIDISLNNIKIDLLLNLAGFSDFVRNAQNVDGKVNDEVHYYFKIYKIFCKSKELRKKLIELNSKNPNQDHDSKEILELLVKEDSDNCINDPDCKKQIEIILKELFSKPYPLAFLLEKMVFSSVKVFGGDNISDIRHSYKITHDETNKMTDEFDVIVATKAGKLLIFECKSGLMSGDNAKSTKYSTYAVAGVYGLPILITPLVRDELNEINNKDHLSPLYRNIKAAVRSAQRALLDVWGVDEISSKLKNYLILK